MPGGRGARGARLCDHSCICPVVISGANASLTGEEGTFRLLEQRNNGRLCHEISAGSAASCAASTSVEPLFVFNDADALVKSIAAIEAAGAGGANASQCPTYGSATPYYAGLHDVDDDLPYTEASRDSGAQP